jgi:hypothetical protein
VTGTGSSENSHWLDTTPMALDTQFGSGGTIVTDFGVDDQANGNHRKYGARRNRISACF